jgi:hypothetical protein
MTDPYLRPGNILHSFSRLYPDAWKQVDEFRASRKELGDWADWCFLPLAGTYEIVSIVFEKKSISQLEEIAGFWRQYFTVIG